jgi:hypothetical protein
METHFWKGDIMLKINSITMLTILVATLPGNLIANDAVWTDSGYEMNWTSGDLQISSSQWDTIDNLYTYNDVTVEIFSAGPANFYMYDNSTLTMYGGEINYLYLYENATASFFGSSYMNELYIDPASTGWVKLYAYDIRFEPYGPYGKGTIYGNWLSNNMPFQFDLTSNGAYSHVQVVPEPATFVLLGMGILALHRRK